MVGRVRYFMERYKELKIFLACLALDRIYEFPLSSGVTLTLKKDVKKETVSRMHTFFAYVWLRPQKIQVTIIWQSVSLLTGVLKCLNSS